MKLLLNVRLIFVVVAIALPYAAMSTVFFTDNFSSSTTNQTSTPGGTATASSTSYDLASSKNADTSTIGSGLFSLHLAGATTSGYLEAQALFTTNPVVLTAAGDYLNVALVFTNSSNSLFAGTASPVWIGLYNSASAPRNLNPPVAGALANAGLTTTAGSPYATNNCELWAGYAGEVYSGTGSFIITRPVQNGATTSSANQELLGNNVSGGTFDNPGGTKLVTSAAETFTVAATGACTLSFNIMLDPAGSGNFIISNALVSPTGTLLFSNSVSTATILATAFDGLAFGAFSHNGSENPQLDVSSITVTGQSTPTTNPPTITSQPSAVSVATGGSCAFLVTATGENVTYQWHRNHTNLVDGGNISGSTTSQLVISPAGLADVLSGANGYYVTVSGAGGYSVNSTTNSLALISATSLIWSGSGTIWDVNNTADWQNASGAAEVFNFGDPVTINNVGGGGTVNLNASYLSASSVTVDSDYTYTFEGSGSFAGPGSLIYTGDGQLTLNNANTYSGGTIISNDFAYLYLQDYAGLGAGPVTLALAGGEMEIVPTGSAGLGINGGIVVADDFEIFVDPSGTYGAVFLGDLSGTANKTLTITPGPGNNGQTTRVRAYGINTVYNANLNLAASSILFAPYQGSGSQTYNGIISGAGALMQKGSTTTYLNGQNTYTGGTFAPAGPIGFGCSSVGNVTSGPIGTGPLFLAPDSTTTLTGSGQILAAGGSRTIANPIQYPTGTNNLTLVIGGSNNLTLTGAYTLNGNDLLTTNTFTSRNIQVTNTGLSAIAGVISDGGLNYGLNITGPGVLALANTETYTGPTTVSNATLQVDGKLATASSVTVNSNGFLSGAGTIGGAVTVQSGGGVAPGDQGGIGTLTVNNTLTLQAGSSNTVAINATATTHDLVVANSISYGGTLIVTNISGTTHVGATYTVFSAGAKSGNFTSVIGSPGAGLGWTFNPTTGVITVVSAVNTNPTSISYTLTSTVSVTNLALSWPADHIGWTLQSQTNLASTNWVNVAGSAQTNVVTIPVSQSISDIFYRLVYIP